MELQQFLNAMRVLLNLDFDVLVAAGVMPDDEAEWQAFRKDPFRWAMAADDETSDKLWALMQKQSSSLADAAEFTEDCKRMLPNLYDAGGQLTTNPVTQVYFRAGLLACREYMARFVEQGGDKTTAQSIRANWWPQLGADPGQPRLFDFNEIAEEVEGPNGKVSWKSKPISPSIEALPRAFGFLLPPATEQAAE